MFFCISLSICSDSYNEQQTTNNKQWHRLKDNHHHLGLTRAV
jgi:hypothetical protein